MLYIYQFSIFINSFVTIVYYFGNVITVFILIVYLLLNKHYTSKDL